MRSLSKTIIVSLHCTMYMYNQERIQGGGIGDCPPPEQFQGGDCPPPWELSPAWAIQGGDSQNVPPLSDSGGGQRFFSWYFLVNSFNKWCKIFGECNFRGGTVPPLSPPWGAQGGDKKFFGRFAPDLSPPWAKSCIRHCIYIYILYIYIYSHICGKFKAKRLL